MFESLEPVCKIPRRSILHPQSCFCPKHVLLTVRKAHQRDGGGGGGRGRGKNTSHIFIYFSCTVFEKFLFCVFFFFWKQVIRSYVHEFPRTHTVKNRTGIHLHSLRSDRLQTRTGEYDTELVFHAGASIYPRALYFYTRVSFDCAFNPNKFSKCTQYSTTVLCFL